MVAVPPLESETSRWFAEEVQPHEPILRAYLRKKFPTLRDIDDVVQESYLKIVRAKINGRLHSARGFLFTAASNVAHDFFRRRGSNLHEGIVEDAHLNVLEDKPGVAETVSRAQELDLLAHAIESLPLRCRQVLKLRKIYGLSHKEIAAQLGISERTVNVQIGHGVRRCAEYLQARGVMFPLASSDSGEPS
jgi:RNA polymerase sigma-70 factor (ECF subfamily)